MSLLPLVPATLALALFALPGSAAQCALEAWTLEDAEERDRLGASIALDGDTAAVGELEGNASAADDVGAVHVFRKVAGDWAHEARLTLGDAEGYSYFGLALDLEGDRIAVGAPFVDGPFDETGAAYVFDRDASGWSQVEMIQSPGATYGDRHFGQSLSLDGDRVLIGATSYDGVQARSGAAFLYERSQAGWIEAARLVPRDGEDLDLFGSSVVLQGDLAIVGARRAVGSSGRSGAFYVFTNTGAGWQQTQKVFVNGLNDLADYGVSMSFAGQTLAVGAPRRASQALTPGAVFVYRLNAGQLLASQRIDPFGPVADGQFGQSVALWNERLLVGAPAVIASLEDGPNGSAQLFQRTQGAWHFQSSLSGAKPDSAFGAAVGLGERALLVGAPHHDGAFENTGSVHFGVPYAGSATNYCDSTPNSVGVGARLIFDGSFSLADNDVTLRAAGGVPGSFGVFLYGSEQISTPFGAGVLCVGGGQARAFYLVPTLSTGSLGNLDYRVDLSRPLFIAGRGQILPGAVWNFQLLYRDVQGAANPWNLSDALRLRLCP